MNMNEITAFFLYAALVPGFIFMGLSIGILFISIVYAIIHKVFLDIKDILGME